MKKNKFSRSWKKWAVAMMLASLSFGAAGIAACGGNGGSSSVEVQDPLGVFYFDAGIDEYQLALGANNKVTFTANGESKVGTYTSDGSVVTIKFDGEEAEVTAMLDGDVLSWNYNDQQMRFFKKVFYTVSYDEKGGADIADVTVVNGKTIAKPADPVREGYQFLGWYADSDYQTPFMFDTQLVTGDMTIYAKWAMVDPGAVAYIVDFDLGYEGGYMPEMETISGKLFDVPDAKRDGYKFCGWWISAYENGEKLTYKYTPDTVFTGNTTLFAVWESDSLGSKLSAPQAQITETGIIWDGVSGVSIYRLKVTGPEGFLKIDEDVSATSFPIDFANAPAGDYDVEITAIAPNQSNNSETVKRSYINKAVGRVSQFSVLDGKVLLFNRVENAEVYYITVECGNESHNHTMYNNGDSVYYSFSNCEMVEGGIQFTVTAAAEGYAPVVSETFVYNRSLDKVEGVTVDEETQMVSWYPVKNATNYIVSVSCGNKAHDHQYIDVGSRTSFSLKECSAVIDGDIKINVYAQTKGYNSPAPTEYSYNKTKLAAPSGVTMTNVDKKYIVSWNPVTDYAGGTVEYSVKIGNVIVKTTETSIDVTEAFTWIPEEVYEVEVKATSETNESVWSDAVKVRYYAMSNKMTYKAGVLSWEPVIGATGYEVRVNDGSVKTVNDGSTSLNIQLTKEGTNYIYVRFVDTTANYYSPNWVTYEINNAMQIIFDGRGSKETIPTQYKVVGDYLSLPTPTRDGYDFVGWYNTPKGPESNGAMYESGIFDGNSELVLYAYWTPAAVTLTYANVNTEGKGMIEQTSGTAIYTKDYKLDVPVLEDKTMVFLGWFAGVDSSAEQLTDDRGYSLKPWALTSGATVYAQYVKNVLEFNLLENDTYSVVRGINASKLTSITIPDTYNSKPVTVVDGYAFRECSRLVSVNIPDTIEIVSEETAFQGCRRLEEVNVYHVEGNRTAVYSSIDGVLLYKNDKTGATEISFYPKAKTGAYTIPDVVTEIPMRLFEGTKVTQVTIPTSVTVIRSNAFINCSTVEKIIFEEGGTNELVIEDGAFRSCTGLKNITLPARLSQLAVNEETHTMDIFSGCTALTHINVERGNMVYASNDGVITDKAGTTLIFCPTARKGSYTIPQGIETIGDYAFVDCKLLTEIVIPGYVENVGAHAFEGCTKVAQIRFTGGAVSGMETVIGEYAFAGLTALKKIDFADGSAVSTIGAYAFTGATGLRSLTIPTSMKYIGDYAFEKAEALGTVTFANGDEGSLAFGNYVFSECIGLTKVELPKSVTALNLGVFDGCVNISEIKVDEANEYYKDIEGVVFTKDGKTLMFFPKGRKGDANGEYVIPAGVESISEGAFRGMFHIEKIVINNTITDIGKYAFQDSMALKTLVFEEGNDTAKLVINDEAFSGCAAITAVALPTRTQKIAAKAFYSVNMKTVSFPAGLEEIGDYAFARTAVTAVEIPAGLTVFGEGVFDTCVKLTSVTFAAGFQGTSIPYASFQGTAITTIEIPASIESIGYAAFNGCEKLKSVTFADGGTADLIIGSESANAEAGSIATGAFMNCIALETVEIPDRAILINAFSFSGCSALKSVDVQTTSKLERIGKSAFSGCVNLSYFYFPASIQNSAYVDESTTQEYAIGQYAFMNAGLTSVTFAEGGTGDLSFGEAAFAGCGARTEVGFNEKEQKPIYEYVYLSELNLPNRIAPIYRVYMDGNVGMSAQMEDGINDRVFSSQGFTALTAINIADGGQYYGSKDGVLYRRADNGNGQYVLDTLMLIPINSKSSIEIPWTVSTIGVAETNADDVVVQRDYSGAITSKLTTVTFEKTPDGMEEVPLTIGRQAFYNVTTLTKFEFPERLVGIYGAAFKQTKLTEVYLPANLTVFDTDGVGSMSNGGHFESVTTLKTVTFAKDIQIDTIPYGAFASCTGLTAIEIPASVRTIGANAFKSCTGLTSLTFAPGSELRTIGNNAFYGLKLSELSLPENVTTLDGKVFQSMSNLTKLILPASFSSFSTVVNGQDSYLFSGLNKLAYVEIHDDNPNFKDVDGVVFTKDGTELVYFPKYYYGTTKYEYTIPKGVQSISTYAFKQQTYLTKLTIPADVKYINYQAFYGCSQLTSIVFEEREAPLTIGDMAFQSCSRLNGVTTTMEDGTTKNIFSIPESVRFEGTTAFGSCFNNNYSKNVYIVFEGDNESNSFTSTFQSCTGIVGVENLPTSVASMNKTFSGCTNLKTVTFRDDDIGMIAVMNGTFNGCKSLVSIDLPNVGSFTSANAISDGVYKENSTGYVGTFENCTALTTVTMKSANVFGVNTFKGCTSLVSVQAPDGLSKIDCGAFYGCTALTSFDIPGTVETIGDCAFKGCSKLSAVEVPAFVTTIAKSAFENCTSITDLSIGAGVITIGERAFAGIKGITAINVPDAVETIEPYAFYNCSAVTKISIPKSVKTIGEYAFANCSNVTSITAEDGLETLGDYAFAGFAKAKSFNIPATLVNLGIGVFDGWSSLESLTANGNLDFAYMDGVLYNATYTKIIFVSSDTAGDFVIPETITSISEGLFANTAITSIVLPDTIRSIPARAFLNCTELKSVTMPSALEFIGDRAFEGCTSLTEITIPKTVHSTYEKLWNDCSDAMAAGYYVTKAQDGIGHAAFKNCTALETVIFEDGGAKRLSIGDYAFYGCTSLKGTLNKETGEYEFVIPSRVRGDATPRDVYSAPGHEGSGEGHQRSAQGIGMYAFARSGLINLVFEDETDIIMAEKLLIDIGAFQECASLKSVTFGNTLGNFEVVKPMPKGAPMKATVAAIAENAFYGCRALAMVTFPKDTSKIFVVNGAFEGTNARVEGVTMVDGSMGTDYGDGKAFWSNGDLRMFGIDGCGNCGDKCTHHNPAKGIYLNDVIWAEDFR